MSRRPRFEDMNDSERLQFLEEDRRLNMQKIYDMKVENDNLKLDRDNLQAEVNSLKSRVDKAEADILTKADK